ncbi:MAG TPA: hypothetical protein VGF30_09230 [Bacteroidia bacterium]
MFLLFFLAILFSGLILIAGIIMSISGLAADKPKMRNAGFITFGGGFLTLIVSIYFAVTGVVNKVKETVVEPFGDMIDSVKAHEGDYSEGSLLNDNRAYLLHDTCSNQWIKYIKEESSKKNPAVPNSFYTYFGSQGFSRMPLIYPYAIHCWDSKDQGTLVDESKVTDIETAPGGEENMIFNVSAVNYDANLVLMRISSLQQETNRELYTYTLYEVKGKTSKDYKSEAELFAAAKKAGYKGEKILISLWDYDGMF